MKKLLFILSIISLFFVLHAETFTPKYYLKGYIPITDNSFDLYKFNKGVSFSSTNNFLLPTINPQTKYEILYPNQQVNLRFEINNKQLPFISPLFMEMETFHNNGFRSKFYELLNEKAEAILQDSGRTDNQGLIKDIVIELPKSAVPRTVRRIMGGTEAARLHLDGSQRLTFGVHYNKSSRESTELDDDKNMDINFRQDLTLNLNGTIGRKIHVNVRHTSNSEEALFSNPSTIEIYYEGDEDEIIKRIDGGDVSFQLTGSKYFSSAASSEGLFGIKTQLEAGNLKVTTIIGKEEAKKDVRTYKSGSDDRSSEKRCSDYEEETYFYTVNPEELFVFYTEADPNIPLGWENNAFKMENGQVLLNADTFSTTPNPDSLIYLYYDDGIETEDDLAAITGYNWENPADTTTYHFDRIYDFYYDSDLGMIKINQQLDNTSYLGIIYRDRNNNLVGSLEDGADIGVKLLRSREQDENSETWKYLVQNHYYLGATNIQNDGFSIEVFDKNNTDNTANYDISSDVQAGSSIKSYINYLQLDTNYDDKIDGDDTFVDLTAGILWFPFLRPFNVFELYEEGQETSPIYTTTNFSSTDVNTIIEINGKVGSDYIELPATGILPGSVSIKIDGQELQENVDYMVDYDFGNITLLSEKARLKTSELEIRYEYKPLFSLDNRTLIGLRADLEINENLKFGGTLIYQSEKVQDDRPKIGSENRSMIMSDFDAELSFDPPIFTKIVDLIPFIRTDAESQLNLSAEVAMSIPRIWGNDDLNPKEAYLEDMESILETYSLGISRPLWTFGSKPVNTADNENIESLNKTEMYWYNDDNYHQEDLYDNIPEEDAKEEVTVLTCVVREPEVTGIPHWAGMMRYLGNQTDLSEKKYIQLLTRVQNDDQDDPVYLHLDLGKKIDEDFYTINGGENVKNSEDVNPTNGELDPGEDYGLDNTKGADGDNIEGDDGNDDYDSDTKINGTYPYVNGTEGNGKLDTEDLNRNGVLDQINIYAEYEVQLNDLSEYYINSTGLQDWQMYRIPIDEFSSVNEIDSDSPVDLEQINYARIWFQVKDSVRVSIAEMDIIGNKWKLNALKDVDDTIVTPQENEIFAIGVIDNQRNPHYVSPPNTVIKKNGEETLEQSLMINYENIQPDNYAMVYQAVHDPTSSSINKGMNLLSYGSMKYWVYAEYPENIEGNEELEVVDAIIRIGADSTNYYEIKKPIKATNYNSDTDSEDGDEIFVMSQNRWEEIAFEFSEITELKIEGSEVDTTQIRIVGTPTLTNIKYLGLGIAAKETFSGKLYVDDIRVADPYEEIGFAARSRLSTKFADFSDFQMDLSWNTPNFQTNTDRTINAVYEEEKSLNITNKYYLNKFFPDEWGLSIPVTLKRFYSESIPKYKANSDILREDLSDEEKERQTSSNLTKKVQVEFRQSKAPRNKILAYTIKPTSIVSSIEKKEILSPTSTDTSNVYYAKHTYDIDIPKDSLSIRLLGKYRFYFVPSEFRNDLEFDYTNPKKWRWNTSSDSAYWEPVTNSTDTKTVKTDTYLRYDIFSDLYGTYDLDTDRDLMLDGDLYGVPIGQEKQRNQMISFSHSPHYADRIFTLSTDIDFKYHEEKKKTTASDTLRFVGNNDRSEIVTFQLKNRDLFENWAEKFKTQRSNEVEPDDGDDEDKDSGKDDKDAVDDLRRNHGNRNPRDTKDNIGEEDPIPQDEKNKEDKGKDEKESKDGKEDKNGEENTKEGKKSKKPSVNIFGSLFSFLSRLDNIQVKFKDIYSSSYDERDDRPEFLYQIGIPNVIDNTELNNRSYKQSYSASSGLVITENLTTMFSYGREINKSYTTANSSQNITTNYPNLDVTLSRFEKLFSKITRIDSVLESSRLNSKFNYTLYESGDVDWVEPNQEKKAFSFSPLLSWNANWIGNVETRLSYNHSTSKDVTTQTNGKITRTELSQSVSSNVSYSFSAPSGLKIPFIGDKIRFKNKLTMDVDVSYSKNLNETINTDDKKEVTTDRYNFSIAPGVDYEFNENITGGLTGSYDINEDKEKNETMKIFEINMWVEIDF